MSDKYHRLGKNAILVFVGSFGGKLLFLLMLPFYTKWLSVSDYGIVDLIQVYASLLLNVVTCCITEAIFVFPKGESLNKQKQYFSSGIIFSLASLGILLVLFKIVSIFLYHTNEPNVFRDYIWSIYLLIVTSFFQSYFQQFTRSIDKLNIYVFTGIIYTLSVIVLSFILIPIFQLYGYIMSMIVANVFAILFTVCLGKLYQFLELTRACKNHIVMMLHYSIPLIPNSIMWWLVSSLNRPLIESYCGLTEVGLFSVANKFPIVLNMLYVVFATSWQISVLEEFKKKNYNVFFNRICKFVFVGLIYCACFLSIFSNWIIKLVVDSKYSEAWQYIPILALSVVFANMAAFIGTNFSATRETKYYFLSTMWGSVLGIIMNFILIPYYGLYGASISILFSNIIMFSTRLFYVSKFLQVENIKYYIYLIIINVLFIIVAIACDNINIRIFLFSILLLLLVFSTKSFWRNVTSIVKNAHNKFMSIF